MANDKKITFRKFSGKVVSDSMSKTIVVLVERKVWHKRYNKQYTVSKKFKVHDEKEEAKVGDKVIFVECRPISKDKRWRLRSIVVPNLKTKNK